MRQAIDQKFGKEEAKEGDSVRNKSFENLPHIPGNPEVHTHAEGWTHALKRP